MKILNTYNNFKLHNFKCSKQVFASNEIQDDSFCKTENSDGYKVRFALRRAKNVQNKLGIVKACASQINLMANYVNEKSLMYQDEIVQKIKRGKETGFQTFQDAIGRTKFEIMGNGGIITEEINGKTRRVSRFYLNEDDIHLAYINDFTLGTFNRVNFDHNEQVSEYFEDIKGDIKSTYNVKSAYRFQRGELNTFSKNEKMFNLKHSLAEEYYTFVCGNLVSYAKNTKQSPADVEWVSEQFDLGFNGVKYSNSSGEKFTFSGDEIIYSAPPFKKCEYKKEIIHLKGDKLVSIKHK